MTPKPLPEQVTVKPVKAGHEVLGPQGYTFHNGSVHIVFAEDYEVRFWLRYHGYTHVRDLPGDSLAVPRLHGIYTRTTHNQ